MKKIFNQFILFAFDILTFMVAVYLSFFIRSHCDYFKENTPKFDLFPIHGLTYLVLILLLFTAGIYSKRYDFWQDTYHIIKNSLLSVVVVLAILALSKNTQEYSRFIIIIIYINFILLAPLQKYLTKRLLFKIGIWKVPSKVIGEDDFFEEHVYKNPYLGYTQCFGYEAKTLFISSSIGIDALEDILHQAIIEKQEVIFIPLVKNFDFSDAHIIHLYNARTNLILVENNLLDKKNISLKFVLDLLTTLLLFPFMLVAMLVISIVIKLNEHDDIFFKQKRFGKNSKEFTCYKFRTMKKNSQKLLQEYLLNNPDEVAYYEKYHKYKNDPRITKIGSFLRKTSLDELPQVLNILKGEMSLIGPRPYMLNEKEKIGKNIDLILSVKPGITGLWQVSGRNEIYFKNRVNMDAWYVRNWSAWNDIVILIKTVQTVLLGKGAS